MHLDRRGYAYETFREGGRVCRRYVGRGEIGAALCQMDALDRQRADETAHAAREVEKRGQMQLDELRKFCGLVQAVLRADLESNGFHQHKRGAWRKRRGDKNDVAKTTKALATVENLAQLDTKELTRKALGGDEKAAAQLWRPSANCNFQRCKSISPTSKSTSPVSSNAAKTLRFERCNRKRKAAAN